MKHCSLVLFVAALIAISSPSQASDPLSLQVSPSVSTAPAVVNVRAWIERDPDNRGIEVSADSDEFFRSSFIALDGDKAPFITELAFKGLPGGDYDVSVVLHGSQGVRARQSRKVRIIESLIDSR
jgi:hypothetical protein